MWCFSLKCCSHCFIFAWLLPHSRVHISPLLVTSYLVHPSTCPNLHMHAGQCRSQPFYLNMILTLFKDSAHTQLLWAASQSPTYPKRMVHYPSPPSTHAPSQSVSLVVCLRIYCQHSPGRETWPHLNYFLSPILYIPQVLSILTL